MRGPRPDIIVSARLETPWMRVQLAARLDPVPLTVEWQEAEAHLFCSLSGPVPGRVHSAGARLNARPPIGEVFFVPAGMPFEFVGEAGGNHQHVSWRFHAAGPGAPLDGLATLAREHTERCFDIRNRTLTLSLRRVAAELRQPGLASELLTDALTRGALVDLTRHLSEADAAGSAQGGLAGWRLKRIEERLADADGEAPTVGELAALVGLSADHLARAFRQTTGETLHQYAERVRLNRAKAFLADTALPLKEIARRLGFARPSGFSAAFRRLAGETPLHYRQRSR
jgi:AraC family transcriptional regulator